MGIQAVDAQTVAAMLAAGAVQVATAAQMQPHMGAAAAAAEEDQIARTQQAVTAGCHCHRLAKTLLLIGIPRDPDPGRGVRGLGEAGTIEIGAQAAAPEVLVGALMRLLSEGQHGRNRRRDRRGIQEALARGAAGRRMTKQSLEVHPAGVTVLQQTGTQAGLTEPGSIGAWIRQQLQVTARGGLAGQAGTTPVAVEIDRSTEPPDAAGPSQFRSQRCALGQAA